MAPRLVLAPASDRGWFGGSAVIATGAADVTSGVTLLEAAQALQSRFEGSGPGLTAVLAAYDGTCTIVRFADVRRGADAASALSELAEQAGGPAVPPAKPLVRDAVWDMTPARFRAGVGEVREAIAAGDVYVVNLTARLTGAPGPAEPLAAFAALQERAAADMAALLEGLPGAVSWVASVSPERFLHLRRDCASADAAVIARIEPIKGTRPRGSTPSSDARLARELAQDPKERAEHVMVVDMERNDLGVCCVPGTVCVEPLYEVVTTPYCHQLVSTVRGILRPDATFAELLDACFPCGSVTGAPKRAAMRLIEATEASARGAYCGALLVAVAGELDSSVLIRTQECSPNGTAGWGAGSGLTYDSSPAAEYLELLLKASPVTGDPAPPVALRETMRVTGGRVPLLDLHLARLAHGGAGPTVLAHVRQEAEQLAAGTTRFPARLGVTVTPDGCVAAGLTHDPSSLAVEGGPRIAAVEVAHGPQLPPGAAKPASRRYWDKAHSRARMAGADQAVLHLPNGTLIDGSTANLWLVAGGRLLTPPAPPAVAGVAREVVFDVARGVGTVAVEQALTLADLESADEVWLCNAVGGFVAARGRGGPVGAAIAEAFEAALSFGGCPPGHRR